MEQTPLPPLVSDEQIRDTFMYGSLIKDPEHGFMSGANYVRHEYEQDRAKTQEVLQALVDALEEISKYSDCGMSRSIAAEVLAKSQPNIEPTNP